MRSLSMLLRALRCVVLGRCRAVGDSGEGDGDLRVAACGRVLVPQRGTERGVSKSRHEFREGSAGLRGKHGAGVPQVVEPQVGPARSAPRTPLAGSAMMSVTQDRRRTTQRGREAPHSGPTLTRQLPHTAGG